MRYSLYSFLSSVFNLPSNFTLNNYTILDFDSEDGILHETLADVEHDFQKQHQGCSVSTDHEK